MTRWVIPFLLLPLCLWGAARSAEASDEATWIRYAAISPDGQSIAFSYLGDIWVVGVKGGRARPITTHAAYERSPVWSGDSQTLAFASDRHGNFDVFTIPVQGGRATRLTHYSGSDIPSCFSPDDTRVWFTSRRLDDAKALVASRWMPELYSIPVEGGRPRQELTTPASAAVISPSGKLVAYEDIKGFENALRKHHTSSVTRDIWTWNRTTGKHTKFRGYKGEDRNPAWSPQGDVLYFLSEESGSSNVWAKQLDGQSKARQVTKHTVHPVRFLSSARNGTLAYTVNGSLYARDAQGRERKVQVTVRRDDRTNPDRRSTLRDGATDMAVSPKGDEVAFVVRGDVFVTSAEYPTTRRVTDTPEQERSVTWSRDGRSIYYAGERDGSWNLYRTKIERDEEKRFATSTILTEEPVLVGPAVTFQPVMSPDGKRLAYLYERDELRVLDLESKQSRTLVPAARNYSYSDGDIKYAWSPDGRWIALGYLPRKIWIDDVGVVNVETGKITNISDSGYYEGLPKWGADGRALFFISDRFGRRSHGGWGSEDDVMAFYLTEAAYDRALLDPEEFALRVKQEEKDKKEQEKKKAAEKKKEAEAKAKEKADDDPGKDEKPGETEGGDGSGDEGKKDDEPLEPIEIDLASGDDMEHRIRRVTMYAGWLGDYAVSHDGEAIVYTAQSEGKWGLWLVRPRDKVTRRLTDLRGRPRKVTFSKDGKQLFVLAGGAILRIEVAASLGKKGGPAKARPVSFAAEMTIETRAERAHLFEHVWRQAQRKFYDPKLHGVDWEGMRRNYAQFLDQIDNNYDFADLLSELLGELNASHTGASHRPKIQGADASAGLGLIYDQAYSGAGLRVAEVIHRGPADKADSKIEAGTILTHIQGVELTPTTSIHRLLNHMAGKRVRLGLKKDGGEAWEEVIRPVPVRAELGLLYHRGVNRRRAIVEKASSGRLGYVHVRSMNDASYRETFHHALGRYAEKEALIVDTRFNGGGWLHDDLVSFLEGRDYIAIVPRGKKKGDFGGEPVSRWSRPSCVLQNEGNYSDAHMFPYAYQKLGIGKLVGTPVPGTGTAVWWETLIDPTLTFGIPQVGMMDEDGNYLENQELQPDVLVYNDPEGVIRGEDKQLLKAIEVLLEELDAGK